MLPIMDRNRPAAASSGVEADSASLSKRVARADWAAIEQGLWARGYAATPPLLGEDECRAIASLYDDNTHFRARVQMSRHRFGEGEYKYFAAPLLPFVRELREAL
jgi:hypothetical protein